MRSRLYNRLTGRFAALALAFILAAVGFGSALSDAAFAAGADARKSPADTGILREGDAEIDAAIVALLEAPNGVRIESIESEGSPNAVRVTFSKSRALEAWFAQSIAEHQAVLENLGYEECKVFAQIDWAIDDPKDWRYSAKWDTETGRAYVDEEHPDEYVLGGWAYVNIPCAEEGPDTAVIFENLGDPKADNDPHWLDGEYSVGWGSVLKQSQYSVVTVASLKDGNTDNTGDNDNGNTDNTGDNGNTDNTGEDDESGPFCALIDMEKHTLFVRVRYGVKLTKKDAPQDVNNGNNTADNGDADDNNGNTDDNGNNDSGTGDGGNDKAAGNAKVVYAFSEWSNIAAYGAEGSNPMYRLADLFGAPQLSEFQFLGKDAGGYGPFIVYTLTVSEETIEAARAVELEGGYAWILLEARRVGDENWTELLGETEILNGENKVELAELGYGKSAEEDAKDIELRGLFYVYGPDGTEYESVYSDTYVCPAKEKGSSVTDPDPTPSVAPTPTSSPDLKERLSQTVEKKKNDKCGLCGVCPVQPLGICLFVWVGGIILILALSIFFTRKNGDRKRRSAKRKK